MTQTTHTPGPWVTARTHAGEGYVHSVRQNIAGQPTIAMVWDDNDDPMIPNPNARLIAAAPELLAALELLVFDCGAHGLDDNDCHLREALAAIAKARGQA